VKLFGVFPDRFALLKIHLHYLSDRQSLPGLSLFDMTDKLCGLCCCCELVSRLKRNSAAIA
jgi:hypothetical protein